MRKSDKPIPRDGGGGRKSQELLYKRLAIPKKLNLKRDHGGGG